MGTNTSKTVYETVSESKRVESFTKTETSSSVSKTAAEEKPEKPTNIFKSWQNKAKVTEEPIKSDEAVGQTSGPLNMNQLKNILLADPYEDLKVSKVEVTKDETTVETKEEVKHLSFAEAGESISKTATNVSKAVDERFKAFSSKFKSSKPVTEVKEEKEEPAEKDHEDETDQAETAES